MTTLETLRTNSATVIRENPVPIAIHRVEQTEGTDGGRTSQKSDLPAFTGRLVPSKDHASQTNEAGPLALSGWLLLAPHDADLRAGDGVQDTFVVGGRSFRVVQVLDRKWEGAVYSRQAVLEEVG